MYYTDDFCNKFINVLSKTYNWKKKGNFLIIKSLFKSNLYYIPYLPYGSMDEKKLNKEIKNKNLSNYNFKCLSNHECNKNFDKNTRVTMRIVNKFSNIENLWNSLNHKERNSIRKAKKANLILTKCKNNNELKEFYLILIKSFNIHGTPIPNFKLFLNLFNENLCDFYIIKYKNICIGSFCAFIDNKISTLLYLNTDIKYQSLNISDFIIWKFIKIYFEKTSIFDLGTCRYQSGNYFFKKKYLSIPVKINLVSNNNKNIYSKYNLYIFIWKKLPDYLKVNLSKILSKYIGDY